MKSYGVYDRETRKRIRKTHSRAKRAGVLYLLGALAFTLLAFLPMISWKVSGNQQALSFGTCFKPFGVVSVLYLLIVATAVINLLKSFSQLSWLTKRGTRYVNGLNRNKAAMEKLGKLFSGSFAVFVDLYLLIYIFKAQSGVAIESMAYIALIVGLAVHFLAGVVGGKTSVFQVDGGVEEQKREDGVFVYFVRNLIQVATTFAIVYLFCQPVLGGGDVSSATVLGGVFADFDLAKLIGNMNNLILVVLNTLLLVFTFVLIKHATANTEYNYDGMEGKGMKNFKVFSFWAFVVALLLFVVDSFLLKGGIQVSNYLAIAGIAFVAFVLDCIVKPKRKQEETEEEMPEPEVMPDAFQEMPEQPTYGGYPNMPVYIPQPYPYPYPTPTYPPYGMPMMAPPAAMPPVQTTPSMMPPVMKINVTLDKNCPTNVPAPTVMPAPAPESLKPVPHDEEPLSKKEAKKKKKAEKKERKLKKRLGKTKNADAEKTQQQVSLTSAAPKTIAVGAVANVNVPEQDDEDEMEDWNTRNKIYPAPIKGDYGPPPEVPELPDQFSDEMLEAECPNCGRKLYVREGAAAHRCPRCEKVFSIVKRKRGKKI
ncbi:MAG: hypothetical protein IJV85_05405 [Clostridia bacterium]|nr:hypothetical protein [Clostridia bacterium]